MNLLARWLEVVIVESHLRQTRPPIDFGAALASIVVIDRKHLW